MAPLPEYSPPSHKTSMFLAGLRLLATILWLALKIGAIFITALVAFIAAIIWSRS